MRWLRIALSTAALIFGFTVTQDAAVVGSSSAADVQVVRVEMGYVCGFCGGPGYRTALTTVESSFIVVELKDAGDEKRNPNRKEKRAINKREWGKLVRSVDTQALKAIPQDKTCRPCIDLPDWWVKVEYSDASNISVEYSPGNEPEPVKALKIPSMPVRLPLR